MNQKVQGVSRIGLDAEFENDEARKSSLLLEACLLAAQGQDAAENFALAAQIEEDLARRCLKANLPEKSFIHQFSAAGCWAQAGDFYHAILLCDDLLSHNNLPQPMRQRVRDYTTTLRQRRHQWYAQIAELAEAA